MSKNADVSSSDDPHVKLAKYATEIFTASNSESAYQKIADRFEDDLLDSDEFPAGYFEFALDLLSDERFYSKPGLWNFMLVLGTESHKLTEWHYDQLAHVISSNYLKYLDEDLCLAVCDFFARNYPEGQAKKIFADLKEIETHKSENLQRFADEGLKILALEVRRASRHLQ